MSSIVVNLITGTSLTILSASTKPVDCASHSLEVILLSSIGNFLAMSLVSINQFFDFHQKSFNHEKFSALYEELGMDMDSVLDKDIAFRPDANEITTLYRLKLEKLMSDEPTIYSL
jgi:hypothetical protein